MKKIKEINYLHKIIQRHNDKALSASKLIKKLMPHTLAMIKVNFTLKKMLSQNHKPKTTLILYILHREFSIVDN